MTRKKLLIIIITILALIFLAIFVILLKNQLDIINLKNNAKTVAADSGIPPTNTGLYINEGWDKVPQLQELKELASSLSGGEIEKTSYVQYQNYIYLKAAILSSTTTNNEGDLENINYFKYDGNWSWIGNNKDMPSIVIKALN